MFSDQREYFASFKFQPFVSNWITVNRGVLFFLPTVPPEKSKSKIETVWPWWRCVRCTAVAALVARCKAIVDSALTLNCVERNDRGMHVMRSPSNEVASCRQLDAG